MRPRLRVISMLAVTAMVSAAVGASAPGALGAQSQPTPTQLDEGLLTTDDVLRIFEDAL